MKGHILVWTIVVNPWAFPEEPVKAIGTWLPYDPDDAKDIGEGFQSLQFMAPHGQSVAVEPRSGFILGSTIAQGQQFVKDHVQTGFPNAAREAISNLRMKYSHADGNIHLMERKAFWKILSLGG